MDYLLWFDHPDRWRCSMGLAALQPQGPGTSRRGFARRHLRPGVQVVRLLSVRDSATRRRLRDGAGSRGGGAGSPAARRMRRVRSSAWRCPVATETRHPRRSRWPARRPSSGFSGTGSRQSSKVRNARRPACSLSCPPSPRAREDADAAHVEVGRAGHGRAGEQVGIGDAALQRMDTGPAAWFNRYSRPSPVSRKRAASPRRPPGRRAVRQRRADPEPAHSAPSSVRRSSPPDGRVAR